MLFTLDIKQGETREITGEGRYLNVLSASAGKVNVRALFKGSYILSSDMLAGDAVELNRTADRLYLTMPEYGVAVIWYSDIKLQNNGVTVKAAGQLKATRKQVFGLNKLNTITAQNQAISVRPEDDITIVGADLNLAEGYTLQAGVEKEFKVSGDIYGYVQPAIVTPPEVEAVKTLNGTAGTNSRTSGGSPDLLVYHSPISNSPVAVAVINGANQALPTSLVARVGPALVAFGTANSRWAYRNGTFYNLRFDSSTGNYAIFESSDLVSFKAAAVRPATGESIPFVQWGVGVAFDVDKTGRFACIASGNQSTPRMSVAVVVDMANNVWQYSTAQVDFSTGLGLLAGVGKFAAASGSSLYAISASAITNLNITGLGYTASDNRKLAETSFGGVRALRDKVVLLTDESTGWKVDYLEMGGFEFDSATIATAGDTLITAKANNLNFIDLGTGQKITVPATGSVASKTVLDLKVMQDDAGQAVLVFNTAGTYPDNGLHTQPLPVLSGTILPKNIEVLELF